MTQLTAADGHTFDLYVAEPPAGSKRGIVVIQEIFGVNNHIRRVTDGYAADGFIAVAPALFDRKERGVELGYDAEGFAKGRDIVMTLGGDAIKDIAAAVDYLADRTGRAPAVVGYCYGGTMAWLAAAQLPIACAIGYYGGQIAAMTAMHPKVPVQLHFGERDAHIPMTDVDKIRDVPGDVEIFTYDAGHGFNCDERADFDQGAAALARGRALNFLDRHLPA